MCYFHCLDDLLLYVGCRLISVQNSDQKIDSLAVIWITSNLAGEANQIGLKIGAKDIQKAIG